MNILNWKQKDTWGRQYQLHAEGQPLGVLSFEDWLSHNAVYTSDATTIDFRKSGWFDQNVEIIRNGDKAATARTNLFSKTKVQLADGQTYTLESESFSNNRYVRNEAGVPVINFRQSAFSFSKGDIVVEQIPDEYKEVIVSTSLYLKLITDNTIAILVMMFICFVIIFT